MEGNKDPREKWSDVEFIACYGYEARILGGRPLLVGEIQRAGWHGPLKVYLLWCPDCDIITVTHPAGYARRLECQKCRQRFDRLKPATAALS